MKHYSGDGLPSLSNPPCSTKVLKVRVEGHSLKKSISKFIQTLPHGLRKDTEGKPGKYEKSFEIMFYFYPIPE